MKIKFLKNEEDKEKISNSLKSFYKSRTSDYYKNVDDYYLINNYVSLIAKNIIYGSYILELGSGSWEIPYKLFQKGFNVTGCDIWSKEYLINLYSLMPKPGPKLINYDGIKLPFKNECFDCVCSLDVFEHLINVQGILDEIDRVLIPKGKIIIKSPNWAGINNPIRSIQSILMHKNRYWRYENIQDSIIGFLLGIYLPFKIYFMKNNYFIYIYPHMKNNNIDYEVNDDDVVHLSCPMSYKKWFKDNNYNILKYNNVGNYKIVKIFNSIFPSWANTVEIIAQKKD